MAAELGLPTGIVVTGGSFENSETDEERIRALDGSAVEMEAAAVARISMQLQVPFMAVKSIVNLEEDPAFADQFALNFEAAGSSLGRVLARIVTYLGERGIEFETDEP